MIAGSLVAVVAVAALGYLLLRDDGVRAESLRDGVCVHDTADLQAESRVQGEGGCVSFQSGEELFVECRAGDVYKVASPDRAEGKFVIADPSYVRVDGSVDDC